MSTRQATIGGDPGSGCSNCRSLTRAFWWLAPLAVSWTFALAAQDGFIDREPQIKAAYLYQFVRYVQWPSESFADGDTPLVIGTVGEDPVNDQLRLIAQKRTAGQRRLVYLPVRNAEQAAQCHILFFSENSDSAVRAAVIARTGHAPILLVGEGSEFINEGGIISFIVVDNKVRLRLSMRAAADHQLKISSQLAKLAEVVN